MHIFLISFLVSLQALSSPNNSVRNCEPNLIEYAKVVGIEDPVLLYKGMNGTFYKSAEAYQTALDAKRSDYRSMRAHAERSNEQIEIEHERISKQIEEINQKTDSPELEKLRSESAAIYVELSKTARAIDQFTLFCRVSKDTCSQIEEKKKNYKALIAKQNSLNKLILSKTKKADSKIMALEEKRSNLRDTQHISAPLDESEYLQTIIISATDAEAYKKPVPSERLKDERRIAELQRFFRQRSGVSGYFGPFYSRRGSVRAAPEKKSTEPLDPFLASEEKKMMEELTQLTDKHSKGGISYLSISTSTDTIFAHPVGPRKRAAISINMSKNCKVIDQGMLASCATDKSPTRQSICSGHKDVISFVEKNNRSVAGSKEASGSMTKPSATPQADQMGNPTGHTQ